MYIVWWIHVADSRLCRRQYCADVRNRGLKSPRLFMSTSSRRSRSSFTTHNSLLTAHRSKCLMSNPFGEICAICVSKNFGRCTQTSLPLITQNSPLIAHHSLLKNLSYLRHRRSIVHICQKTRKRDFGPSEENQKITNPLIVKQTQNHEKLFENTRKKDLSVSWVLLKSFRSNT